MASKVLVPAPFKKLQVKKPSQDGSGFLIGDPAARVAHLEHSVRFLQEQHRLMLNGLHNEIEALRERNRDLQFQLIFNKEAKASSPRAEENIDNTEITKLKSEVSRLEREAAASRGEARAAEARALQLQQLVDAQIEKLRELESGGACCCAEGGEEEAGLRARLADAERLVRRLRGDADRQRRELQCMKQTLHASLHATGLDTSFGYQNNYHFPTVPTPDFWREPLRDEFSVLAARRGSRRQPTLPDLSAQRSTVYANNHTRPRANGFETKTKKTQQNIENIPVEETESRLKTSPTTLPRANVINCPKYPELKIVVTKIIPHGNVNTQNQPESRPRARRHTHRKHGADHT